jgi:lipopolysaccharide assembly protein A
MRQTVVITLLLLAVAFSLLNVAPLTIDFLIWRAETLVAVAVIGALTIGLIVGALLMLPWGLREHKALKLARQRIAALENERRVAALPHAQGKHPGATSAPEE